MDRRCPGTHSGVPLEELTRMINSATGTMRTTIGSTKSEVRKKFAGRKAWSYFATKMKWSVGNISGIFCPSWGGTEKPINKKNS